jgi:hypothetical protein
MNKLPPSRSNQSLRSYRRNIYLDNIPALWCVPRSEINTEKKREKTRTKTGQLPLARIRSMGKEARSKDESNREGIDMLECLRHSWKALATIVQICDSSPRIICESRKRKLLLSSYTIYTREMSRDKEGRRMKDLLVKVLLIYMKMVL